MTKKVYFLLPFALLILLTSCDKNISGEKPLDGRIEFTTAAGGGEEQSPAYADAATRGVEIDNATLRNFKVFAYYTPGVFNAATSTPNFMYNTEVAKSGSAWQYEPLMYWPNSGKLSFFAYAPAATPGLEMLSTPTTPGPPKLTYTVPDLATAQSDLLVATPLYDQTTANVNGAHKLVIPFKHALSCIVFQAKMTDAATYPVKITGISIESLDSKADYVYNGSTTPWDLTAYAPRGRSYSLTTANAALKDVDLKSQTADYLTVSADNAHLMVLPQQVADATDQVSVHVEQSTSPTPNNYTVRVALSKLIPGSKLEAGKRYVIKILVATASAAATLTCTVEPWVIRTVDVPEFN